jgi:outer membrane protein assembly factor BamB
VPARSSPVLVGDLIFMVSDAGVASIVEAKTGKPIRQRRLEGEFSTSPLYADGRVYLSNQEGSSFVLSADRKLDLLATNKLDDGTMASPAVYDKAIYLRTKTHLYRLEQ